MAGLREPPLARFFMSNPNRFILRRIFERGLGGSGIGVTGVTSVTGVHWSILSMPESFLQTAVS